MSGPYRTQLARPERFESFWIHLERRRKTQRKLPFVLAAIALVPALAVISITLVGRASADEPRLVMEKALSEPWGLVVSPFRVDALVGTRPTGAIVPDSAASPIPAAELQRLLFAQGDGIRKCYAEMSRSNHELSGDLIVSLAILDGRQVSALTGKESLRHSLGWCIRRELESVKFPAHDDVAWVHFPLRFSR